MTAIVSGTAEEVLALMEQLVCGWWRTQEAPVEPPPVCEEVPA